MKVVTKKPQRSAIKWMGCQRKSNAYLNDVYNDDDDDDERKEPYTSSAHLLQTLNAFVLIYCLLATVPVNF